MNSYSTQYISVIAMVLAQLAGLAGLKIGTPEITTAIITIVTLAGGAKILWERYKKGGINPLGIKTDLITNPPVMPPSPTT